MYYQRTSQTALRVRAYQLAIRAVRNQRATSRHQYRPYVNGCNEGMYRARQRTQEQEMGIETKDTKEVGLVVKTFRGSKAVIASIKDDPSLKGADSSTLIEAYRERSAPHNAGKKPAFGTAAKKLRENGL